MEWSPQGSRNPKQGGRVRNTAGTLLRKKRPVKASPRKLSWEAIEKQRETVVNNAPEVIKTEVQSYTMEHERTKNAKHNLQLYDRNNPTSYRFVRVSSVPAAAAARAAYLAASTGVS